MGSEIIIWGVSSCLPPFLFSFPLSFHLFFFIFTSCLPLFIPFFNFLFVFFALSVRTVSSFIFHLFHVYSSFPGMSGKMQWREWRLHQTMLVRWTDEKNKKRPLVYVTTRHRQQDETVARSVFRGHMNATEHIGIAWRMVVTTASPPLVGHNPPADTPVLHTHIGYGLL